MADMENVLSVSDGDAWSDAFAEIYTEYGENGSITVVPDLSDLRSTLYDEELNALPVYIVEPVEYLAASSAPLGAGYQISDYWINVFNGILDKQFAPDYYAFATRVQTTGYNYVTHYWLYIGDVLNGGEFTVYDCYSIDGIYYMDQSVVNHGAFDCDANILVYSNRGSVPDLRKGGSVHAEKVNSLLLAVLLCLSVCRGLFHWYMHHFKC